MLQINVLAHYTHRLNFLTRSLYELKKIKNKDKVKLVIGYTTDAAHWTKIKKEFNDVGILCEIFQDGNYMNKIRRFITSECEYSCSMDEDIILNQYLWDFMIENISVLDNDKNLILIPLISNGIPTTEKFIEDFCNNEQKEEMHNIFRNTNMRYEHMVGHTNLDYSFLDNWDETFISRLNQIDHHYRGIHPIRMSYEANIKIAQIICGSKTFFDKKDYTIEIEKIPYFCNSFYMIKTKTWASFINDNTLYRDPFDEVPLNLYMRKTDSDVAIVRNGFCIHMCYNTVNVYDKSGQKKVENYYYKNL
jgi:hypothetical protein